MLACRRQESANEPAPPPAETLPLIRVDGSRADLIFTYFDPEAGSFKSASRIENIPDERRKNVVVVDLSLSPEERGAGRYVAVADLTRPREDGTYPVALASRFGFETQTHETQTSTQATRPHSEVILYTASWCGVCKKAKRFLDALKVRYVERDIEASRRAAQELAEKAQRAGIQPGGVPVIDVGGVLLQGFEEASLRRMLEERGFL